MINIPIPIQQFIQSAMVSSDMHLPFHYTSIEAFEGYQSTFRYHGNTGEDLTSTTPGEWQPGWYVIAFNGFDDPFFVDFNEEDKGFPVYYAPIGAGKWEPVEVAPSIAYLTMLLADFKTLPSSELEARLTAGTYQIDQHNEFWEELHAGLKKDLEEASPSETPTGTEEIIINGQSGQIVPIHSLIDKLPEESFYKRYAINNQDWLQSKALYFSGNTVIDSIDLDNPFDRAPTDWRERYDKARAANDTAAIERLWHEYDEKLIRLILVEGNLEVKRYIINDEIDGASGIVVLGDLHCPYCIVGGQQIFVQGNLTVQGLYWGDYNHGALAVTGNTHANVFIETDEYRVDINGVFQTAHHWVNDSFIDNITEMQSRLVEDCFSDPQGSYPKEVLSWYTMQQCVKEGKSLLKTEGSISFSKFKNYELSFDNLRILSKFSIIKEEYFRYKVEDVEVQVGREHTDKEGKTWYPSIHMKQDESKVFACIIRRPQGSSYAETLEVMWQAPDNDWYYVDEQTPLAHRNLIRHFVPRALYRAEQMEKLSEDTIAACAAQVKSHITPEKIAQYLSRPIVTKLYNDYYSNDYNGYWNGSVYFSFRQNDDTYCDRIQLVKQRNDTELQYYPSVTGGMDISGYQFDLEVDESGNRSVAINYLPHNARGSYPLTPLDVDHYQRALVLWQYFETAFIKDNALFEAGDWQE